MGQSASTQHTKLEDDNKSKDGSQGCFCCGRQKKTHQAEERVGLTSKDRESEGLLFAKDCTENATEHSQDDTSSSNNINVTDDQTEGETLDSVKSNNSQQGEEEESADVEASQESPAGDGTLLQLSENKGEEGEEEEQEKEIDESDKVNPQLQAINKILLEISTVNDDYKQLSSIGVPFNLWLSMADGVIVNSSHVKLSSEEITNSQLTSCQDVKDNVAKYHQQWNELSTLVERICLSNDDHVTHQMKSSLQAWSSPLSEQLSLLANSAAQLVEQLPESAETAEMFESTYSSFQKWLLWAEKESLHLMDTESTRVLSPKLVEKYQNLNADISAHQPYIVSVKQLAQLCIKSSEDAAQIGRDYQSRLTSLGVNSRQFKESLTSQLLQSAASLSEDLNIRYTNLKEAIANLLVKGTTEG